jgi:hypothetical protein
VHAEAPEVGRFCSIRVDHERGVVWKRVQPHGDFERSLLGPIDTLSERIRAYAGALAGAGVRVATLLHVESHADHVMLAQRWVGGSSLAACLSRPDADLAALTPVVARVVDWAARLASESGDGARVDTNLTNFMVDTACADPEQALVLVDVTPPLSIHLRMIPKSFYEACMLELKLGLAHSAAAAIAYAVQARIGTERGGAALRAEVELLLEGTLRRIQRCHPELEAQLRRWCIGPEHWDAGESVIAPSRLWACSWFAAGSLHLSELRHVYQLSSVSGMRHRRAADQRAPIQQLRAWATQLRCGSRGVGSVREKGL